MVFPLRSVCLNIETFSVQTLCSVHVVVRDQDGLALLTPLHRDSPFALSPAVGIGLVLEASKVGRYVRHAHLDTNSIVELLHWVQLAFRARGAIRGWNGVQQQEHEPSARGWSTRHQGKARRGQRQKPVGQ